MSVGKIAQYINSDRVRGLARNTQIAYAQIMAEYQLFLHQQGITEITGQMMEETFDAFMVYLKGENFKGNSLLTATKIIRAFASWHGLKIRVGYRRTNEERRNLINKNSRRWLNEEDANRILAFDGWGKKTIRNRLIVRLLFETGCRVSEIAKVYVRDIDLEKRVVMLPAVKTKTRPAFISVKTTDMLNVYLKLYLITPDDLLLLGIRETRISGVIREMLKALGMNVPGKCAHVFRHFCASNMYYNMGVPVEQIAFILGDNTVSQYIQREVSDVRSPYVAYKTIRDFRESAGGENSHPNRRAGGRRAAVVSGVRLARLNRERTGESRVSV